MSYATWNLCTEQYLTLEKSYPDRPTQWIIFIMLNVQQKIWTNWVVAVCILAGREKMRLLVYLNAFKQSVETIGVSRREVTIRVIPRQQRLTQPAEETSALCACHFVAAINFLKIKLNCNTTVYLSLIIAYIFGSLSYKVVALSGRLEIPWFRCHEYCSTQLKLWDASFLKPAI